MLATSSSTGDKLTGGGHAWNAARIKGQWYLLDSCWDAGNVSRESGFTKAYRTDYLLVPPAVMIQDHYPEDPNWQILAKPLSQGDFLRQPMLSPGFQAAGLTLLAPARACIETGQEAKVIVKNPKKQWLMTALEQDGKNVGYSSDPISSETAELVRALPGRGTFRLNMYVSERRQREGHYTFIGSIDFVNR